jgi:hypothetical protein
MDGATDPGERFDDPLGLRMILGRIRGELVDLGRCADGLQITIGAIVTNSSSRLGLGAQVELQAVDALSQRLQRLARLADTLEARIPEGWALDPTSDDAVTHALSRLADADGASVRRTPQEEGDCELF